MPDISANDELPGDQFPHPADRMTATIVYYKEQNGDTYFRSIIDFDENIEHVAKVYKCDFTDPYTDVLFDCDCGADFVSQGSSTYDDIADWKSLSERHAECMSAALDHIHEAVRLAILGG